jgi:hypothetical protein
MFALEVQPYKSKDFSPQLVQEYVRIWRWVGPASFYDRTETLPHFLNFKNLFPLAPFDSKFNKSFKQVCIERAEEIIAENKKVDVFWSGGLDSTVALIALLNAGIPRERLCVYMTHTSIFEYEWFYYNVIKRLNLPTLIGTSGDVRKYIDWNSDSLIVTGEFGDQLLGSSVTSRWFDSDIDKPYKDLIPGHLIDFMQPMMDGAHMKIDTLFEWLWYVVFTSKWQNIATRFTRSLDPEKHSQLIPRLRHFFSSHDFQQWSRMYHASKPKRTVLNYKQPLRDFIYEYTKDEKYYRLKKKGYSLVPMHFDQPSTNTGLILPDGSTLEIKKIT